MPMQLFGGGGELSQPAERQAEAEVGEVVVGVRGYQLLEVRPSLGVPAGAEVGSTQRLANRR